MSKTKKTEEKYFKLLLPAVEQNIPGLKTIELCGKLWTLVDFERPSDAPPYTCISYSWGEGETPNLFNKNSGSNISIRTMPVTETVINSLQPSKFQKAELLSMFNGESVISEKTELMRKASQAIWVDSWCKPEEQPAADRCLEKMGEIYRGAVQIFVVWNTNCTNAVRKIRDNEDLNLSDFEAIASDDWIDRVWTYPEFLNSKMMFLVAEGDENATFISERTLLLAISTDYNKFADIDVSNKIRRLQNLFGSQEVKGLSAFHAMSGIHFRSVTRPEDRINAMIAVVESAAAPSQERQSITLAEYFRRVCEENDDYSFIFSTDPRSEVLGKSWRPIGNEITPVISDVAKGFGGGLAGILKSTHLQMKNMYEIQLTKRNEGDIHINVIEKYLDSDFPSAILEQLRKYEFTGCGQCFKLEHGYYFPQSQHKDTENLFVAIALDNTFFRGAPGLLLRSNDTDINQFCDIGVFIGIVPKVKGDSINVS